MKGADRISLQALRCPQCGDGFLSDVGTWRCSNCPWRDALEKRPLSLRAEPLEAEERGYLAGMRGRLRRSRLYPLLFWMLAPVHVSGPDPGRRYGGTAENGGLVIDVGAGNDRRHVRFVTVDILPQPAVDIVYDGATLPFVDESVDAAISIAVLEHVPAPDELIRELRRVVRPGGEIYLVVPFLQPFHAAPHDYRRWTRTGLCGEISDGFEVEQVGVYCGPASTLCWLLAAACALLVSPFSVRWREGVELALQALFSPLKWADVILARLPGAERLSSALFVIGRRR